MTDVLLSPESPYAPPGVYDADSHVMELNGWLPEFADPDVRERIRDLGLGAAGALAAEAVRQAEARQGDRAAADALEAKLLSAKGWHALGAFDSSERSRALDLLGFDSQLVFPTFAANQFMGDDAELVRGGTRALNRAMAAFCADDERLVGVASVPWLDPQTTLALTVEALDGGCGAVLFPSHPGRGISPTHPEHDPLWSTLEERRVPFLLHIGGAGRSTKPAFHDNGRPVSDFLGGGENIRAKDYVSVSHVPEQFLSAMILDGVLDDHPRLMGGCIEQGALWVPAFVRLLDMAQRTFSKTEPRVKALSMKASEYVTRQIRVTPFPGEDVGWLIEQAGEGLFMFSSDYPHPEGTRDPIGRFEATMAQVGDRARRRFYTDNYAELMGWT